MKPAAKKSTRLRADAEAVGQAWGLRFYEQRPRRLKQLEAIRAVLERPDFPLKVKGFYDREAVVAWGVKNIELHKNLREFILVVSKDGQSGTDQPAPPTGDLFLTLGPEEVAAANRQRLQRNLMIHLGKIPTPVPLRKFEIDELIAGGLIPKIQGAALGPVSENIEGGYRGVANWIRNNYQGRLSRVPTHTDIQNWNKGEYLPAGCRENFPSSDANNGRYKSAEVSDWVEKHLFKTQTGQELELPMDYRQLQEKLDYERAQAEYDLWKQGNSHKFMETAIVGAFIEGYGTWLGLQQDRFIEDAQGVRAIVAEAVKSTLAATPEQLAILDAQLRPALAQANDAMKLAASRHGAELFKQLVADRREAIQKAIREAA